MHGELPLARGAEFDLGLRFGLVCMEFVFGGLPMNGQPVTVRTTWTCVMSSTCLFFLVACVDDVPRGFEPSASQAEIVAQYSAFYSTNCERDRERLVEEVQKFAAKYDACSVDTDCVEVSASVVCQEGCAVSVAAANLQKFKTDVAAFENVVCPVQPASCGAAFDCVALLGARCVGGHCRASYRTGSAFGSSTPTLQSPPASSKDGG